MGDQHYTLADSNSLAKISWESEAEKEGFQGFVVQHLEENGPTHLSVMICAFFRTDYLSPVFMGRLHECLLALGELGRVGKVVIHENEHLPICLPNHHLSPDLVQ